MCFSSSLFFCVHAIKRLPQQTVQREERNIYKIKPYFSMINKLLIIAVLLGSLSFTAFAQKTSIFHLKVFNNAPFAVVMDGLSPQEARDMYTLRNLPKGLHRLQVFQRVAGAGSNAQSVKIADERIEIDGKREYFAYIDNRGDYRIHQIIFLHDYPQNPYITSETSTNTPSIQPYTPSINQSPNSNQVPNNTPRPNTNNGTATTSSIPANAIAATDFDNLRKAIKEADFDDTRLVIAKQGMKNRSFSTAQIQALLEVIGFESSKLDLAKFAYDYTYDHSNYYQLYSAFKFSTSTDELAKYIANKN